jgi:hypothetical protein
VRRGGRRRRARPLFCLTSLHQAPRNRGCLDALGVLVTFLNPPFLLPPINNAQQAPEVLISLHSVSCRPPTLHTTCPTSPAAMPVFCADTDRCVSFLKPLVLADSRRPALHFCFGTNLSVPHLLFSTQGSREPLSVMCKTLLIHSKIAGTGKEESI